MSEFVTVAKVGEIPPGEGRAFEVDEQMVAVFNNDGEYLAIDDMCPHMGASLAEGDLEDGVVSCSLHGWRYRVSDGTWVDNPRTGVDCFEVKIDGDDVLVREKDKPSAESHG